MIAKRDRLRFSARALLDMGEAHEWYESTTWAWSGALGHGSVDSCGVVRRTLPALLERLARRAPCTGAHLCADTDARRLHDPETLVGRLGCKESKGAS